MPAEAERPRVDNARRLTGRGFFSPSPGAAVELWLDSGKGLEATRAAMSACLDMLLPRLGLEASARFFHAHARGFTVAVTSPIDRALALADALEWAAWTLSGETELTLAEAVARFFDAVPSEADPKLVEWQQRAAALEVPFLWDDDEVSFGLGRHCRVFPARELPVFESFEPAHHRERLPVALITGTNGKTTTTRMTASILRAAGYRVGATGTDAITLDGEVIDAGDWTGPGAARKVLRHPEVTAAVLETARGGILRRGLGYDAADAALVTNVGHDHLGEYGIDSVDAMAAVKAVVWQGVRVGGKRVANLDCPVTLAYLLSAMPEVVGHPDWVMLAADPAHPVLRRHRAGGDAWAVTEHLVHFAPDHAGHEVVRVVDIPATIGGSAHHNVANALAAAALGHALGASHAQIAAALSRFGSDPDDNAGRLERYEIGGVTLVLDFAHNPHGVNAVAASVRHLRGEGRLFVSVGQAGDRSQADVDQLAIEVAALSPDEVSLREMPGYERGRPGHEMIDMLRVAFERAGVANDRVWVAQSEIDFLERALAKAAPGDLIALLVHYQRTDVRNWLATQG